MMRFAIRPDERLAVTLRFLATGESFSSLEKQFRISRSAISCIVIEVIIVNIFIQQLSLIKYLIVFINQSLYLLGLGAQNETYFNHIFTSKTNLIVDPLQKFKFRDQNTRNGP